MLAVSYVLKPQIDHVILDGNDQACQGGFHDIAEVHSVATCFT